MMTPEQIAAMKAQMHSSVQPPQIDIPAPELPKQNWYDGLDYEGLQNALVAMQQPTQMMEPYVHRGGGMVQGPVAPHVSGAGMNTAGLLGGTDDKDDKKDLMKGLLQMIGMGA